MDEALLRKLIRQLRFLNFWVMTFGLLILAGFAVLIFVLFKVVTYTHNLTSRLDNFQQSTQQNLNLQNKLCSNDTASSYLKNSDLCK